MCWCGKPGEWYCRRCGEQNCIDHDCACNRCQCPCHPDDLAAARCPQDRDWTKDEPMTDDAGLAEEPAAEPVPDPVPAAEPAPVVEEAPAPEALTEAPEPAGPPIPAEEPPDHVPPPWLPDTQPDWLREAFHSLHRRIRELER